MLGLRSDLPLDRDAAARFLPWILGFMVYLAALAIGAAMVVDRLADRWQAGLTGNLTIEVPFDPDLGVTEKSIVIDRIVDVLSATPGIAGTTLLDDREIARLLEPWLGVSATELDIPLPALIAVTLRPGVVIDRASLQAGLAAIHPGTTIDDHGAWIDDALAFLRGLNLLAALLTGLVLAATTLTIVFVTRTGLSIHRGVIEIVHLIGATDSYVAQQFQAQALRHGLVGGAFGTLLAAATLLGIDQLLKQSAALAGALPAAQLDGLDLAPGMGLDLRLLPWQWAVLALLPVATAFIAMLTARWTVLRSLARLV
ncbi:cell division transport system permease protein [Dongia mobilis]|uniref:Cell division transport system permease protein n=1 Tax=Dongia mobilis TaxID=578943 RepID=A0A4R6WU54_9PROT|nr:FtsX-like permease family protein [Dongia mobilis]TDQ83919.1 cell division transport system permease protein [Dongia mobilis]